MTTYGPYAPIRRAGNLLFVSGQIGIAPLTKMAAVTIGEQTKQALQNMEHALQAMDAGLQDIVKTTVFLTNMDDFATMNVAYEQAFGGSRPARSTVAVRELPRVGGKVSILVEIEAVAYKEMT